MTQNIYDRPAFFEGYSRMRRSVDGLDGAPEWPSLRAMLPNLTGLRVADLGCGFGWFSRWAVEQGAAHVKAIDVSARMLERALEMGPDRRIKYRCDDLETLELAGGAFDLVYSSLAFHYVRDAGRLYRMIAQALAPGGTLVFSTEHPIYMAASRPEWVTSNDGCRSWPVDGYFREGKRTTDWFAKGVIKYHRTIGTTFAALAHSGFVVERLEEFCPTPQQIEEAPALSEEVERPMFLLLSARLDAARAATSPNSV